MRVETSIERGYAMVCLFSIAVSSSVKINCKSRKEKEVVAKRIGSDR